MSICVRLASSALIAAAGGLFATGSSLAQSQSTGHDWTGPYVGVHAGYAWGEENDNLSEAFDSSIGGGNNADSFDIQGVIGGVHAGYDWQHGQWIFGVEGMFDGSGVDGDHGETASTAPDSDGYFYSAEGKLSFEQNWLASLAGKVGTAFGNLELYGLGGVAFSEGSLKLPRRGQLLPRHSRL